jgi:hypothetical protein
MYPYDKERLLTVARLNALSTEEIIEAIQQRGVDFRTTAEVEAQFREAGARLLRAALAGCSFLSELERLQPKRRWNVRECKVTENGGALLQKTAPA